ncbi:FAD-dependent oxidoreductase [Microcella alkalica]|uniref:Pyruvate/2-oxoglutarate dehydrogenase complex dihydrolipoamide dehydrogenase (E3) component n=1 Tax=Microcella alkalica TaxID=355930 RepID=A0A839E534_9MICO|nr:FAD-dependent oxidoreductase [Microcella alkalica]MBA8846647.1 pyruvate/2-oxoglutarate dehydrogenase complex dihydrolipoamide dehydrogenase (E3) component [Microcella alkalica]
MTALADLPADVDLLVIGGGTAGLVAAKTAAGFGATALLVEAHRMGGDCLWTGCVPSKSLIAAAEAAHSAVDPRALGVATGAVDVDFAAVLAHVHGAIHEIEPVDSVEATEAAGALVVMGRARFTGPRAAEIDGRAIAFRQAVIATGSSPDVPDLPGIEGVEVLTSDSVWELTSRPERLVVLGGGAIGCELGQAFARLGAQVTLVQRNARLLPKEDPDASAIVAEALVADGVDVRVATTVERVEGADDRLSGILHLSTGDRVPFDRLLVALGRRPRTAGLGLDAAGVRTDERGHVTVDESLRTSNRRILAAGDVSGLPQFTHTAGVNGSIAATNAILGLRRRIDRDAVPRVTFTHPEVGAVGLLPSEAEENGCTVSEVRHRHTDRAIADGRTSGFTRLVIDGRGRVLGATIVGPRAGESLGEASLAVRQGLRTSDIASTTHAYPTYSDALWNAAVADVRGRLRSGALARAIAVLARITAWRMR